MSDPIGKDGSHQAAGDPPPEAVAGGSQWHPMTTAAVIGGALAATTGAAYFGTRALAKRNGGDRRPLNSVMATAITACDLSHGTAQHEPSARDIHVSPAPETP